MIKITYKLDPVKTKQQSEEVFKHKEVIPMPKDPIDRLKAFAIITLLFGILIAGLSMLGTITPGRMLEIAALGAIQAIVSVVTLYQNLRQ